MKNILLPTDFSKNAWNALAYALTLYKKTPCTFYILNAFQVNAYTSERLVKLKNSGRAFDAAKEESELGLARFLKGIRFRTENSRHQFHTISTQGDLLEAVQDCVDKKDIDIIIMGKNGQDKTPRIYGSHTTELMEKIKNCPVLVIPENIILMENSIQEIVFTTNLKYPFKQKELSALIDIANRFNAAIRILYIEEEKKEFTKEQVINKETLKDYLAAHNFSFHTLTKVTVPAGIHSFIESRDSNLLTLYKRKKGFFSKLFSPSFVENSDFDPKTPVLILKEADNDL